jgi:hypothetical protein
MTEAEWLACKDPSQMLAILESRGCGSNRKFRLFAVGCCRRIWSGLEDVRSRSAVEAAERFADGLATQSELRTAFTAASAAVADCKDVSRFSENQAIAAFLTAARNINESATKIPENEDANEVASHVWSYAIDGELEGYEKQHAALLRDIAGNPFHTVFFDPTWRTDHTVGIATKMYDERNFDAMPILADTLEDAGCNNPDILNHCREPGVHARGCWVVDLILGKE